MRGCDVGRRMPAVLDALVLRFAGNALQVAGRLGNHRCGFFRRFRCHLPRSCRQRNHASPKLRYWRNVGSRVFDRRPHHCARQLRLVQLEGNRRPRLFAEARAQHVVLGAERRQREAPLVGQNVRLVERFLCARAAPGLQLQRMLGGAERSASFGVPAFQVLDDLALAREPPLDIDEIFLVGHELGARVHQVALLQIGFEAVGSGHVEHAAELALEPVHLHGMTRAQLVALRFELGAPHSDPGQQSPLG